MKAAIDFGENCAAKQALKLGVALGIGLGVGYLVGKKLGGARINRFQDLTNPKIVNVVDIEDLQDKKSFCRCWKSKSFPYCDGSHNEHNSETGDNVGPLCFKHKS